MSVKESKKRDKADNEIKNTLVNAYENLYGQLNTSKEKIKKLELELREWLKKVSKDDSYYDWELSFKEKKKRNKLNKLGISEEQFREHLKKWRKEELEIENGTGPNKEWYNK